ncbi:MAG: MMPL family transporter, partial [Acidisphaera sp.]|nr:MMPL family transporter [Acidisphaera sp.]
MNARRRTAPIALALLVAIGLAAGVFSRIDLHTDMVDFLPQGRTPTTRFMLEELRSGAAATLILIGLEGAPAGSLAEASRAMTDTLDRSGLFAFVNNGARMDEAAAGFLFDHRYLLSPATTAEAFSTAALHGDFASLLENLASSASPLVERYGLADPPGAFPALLRGAAGDSPVHLRQGVWFAGDRDRALIVAKTHAAGVDVNAQRHVRNTIEAAFAQARPEGARLLLAGPAIFTLEAALAIRADLRLIGIVSTILIVALLVWRFRSPWVIAAIAVPIVLSIAAATLAVQLVYGFVHGVTLGFGLTMLGVSVDYPVLLIGHRRIGEALPGTLRRIGKTLALTVVAGVLGLTGMLFSRFPGLSQLGLFSAVGLAVAALATRFVLGPLVVAADIAPASTGAPDWLLRLEGLRRRRAWFLLPAAAALLYLLAIGGPRWERELARLSPVPGTEQALDAELRGEVGAPDVGQLLVVS